MYCLYNITVFECECLSVCVLKRMFKGCIYLHSPTTTLSCYVSKNFATAYKTNQKKKTENFFYKNTKTKTFKKD